MIHYLAVIALAIFTSTAFAVREVGNGGDAIVCAPTAPGMASRVLFYDYYEADQIRRIFPIGFSKTYLSYEDYLGEMLTRVERLNPNRARLYREWIKEFGNEAEFLRGISLIDIPDTGNGYVPTGCKLEQLVVQRTPRFPSERRYTVNLDLYDKLSERDKAGMIFHEVVLREMINQHASHTDSINTRVYNSLASSPKADTLKLKEYLDWLAVLKITRGDTQNGLPMVVDGHTTFHSADVVAKATALEPGDPRDLVVDTTWRGNAIRINKSYQWIFNSAGYLKYWMLEKTTKLLIQTKPVLIEGQVRSFDLGDGDNPIAIRGEIPIDTPALRTTCEVVILGPTGEVESCSLAESGLAAEIFFQGRWVKVRGRRGLTVKLDAQGALSEAIGFDIDNVESSDFRGRCEGAAVYSATPSQISSCDDASGEVQIGGQWINLVPLTMRNSPGGGSYPFRGPILRFDKAGKLEAADAYISWIASPLYKGSCAGVQLENRVLVSCGRGSVPQTTRGEVFIFGAWYEHIGSLEIGPEKQLKLSSVRSLATPLLRGDVESLVLDKNGIIERANVSPTSQVRQVSPTQNQWMECRHARDSCPVIFDSAGRLASAKGINLQSPVKISSANVEFFPTGEVFKVGANLIEAVIRGTDIVLSPIHRLWLGEATLSLTGKIKSLEGLLYRGSVETGSGQRLTLVEEMSFFDDETLETVRLNANTDFPTLSGTKTFRAGEKVRFDKQGRVVEVF